MDGLRVRLLGGFEVEGLDLSALRSRKARTLLKILALARRTPVSTEVLAEAIWPDGPPKQPADQVAVLVSRARRLVGVDRLRRTEAGYVLEADWLDVDTLIALSGEARRRLQNGRMSPARAAATAALDLARGPLLPEEPDAEWAETDRWAVERAVSEARVVAAESMLALGDVWGAVELAQTAHAANAYDEAALRVLMRSHAATGRPALALEAYAQAAARLADELGTDPAAETVEVHLEVLRGRQPPPALLRPAPSAPASAFAGREPELAMLDQALAKATAGAAQLVVIDGEPGIGKTALLDAWAERVPKDQTVLRGKGHEFGGGFPLDAVAGALADHLRTLEPAQVDELLGGVGETLAPVLGGAAAPRAANDLAAAMLGDPGSGQLMLFSAMDTLMARMSDAGPVALLIDDAHLADQASVAWLHHCAARLAHHRILLVVARRLGEGPAYTGTMTTTLEPLDVSTAAEIVGAERAATLHARAGGNPLFLLELSEADDSELPATVRDVVADRCARAGEAAVTVRTAAVLGADVDLELLAQVLPTPEPVLLDHLEEGARRHLLAEDATGFVFAHDVVREALVATTSPPRQGALHRQAAQALARRTRRDARRVAHHARAGHDLPLAATALAEAAEVATDRFDHDEAMRLLDEAVALDDTGALRVRRARARISAGRYADAAVDAGAAAAMGEGAEALEVAAHAAYHVREFARALRLADDGARLAVDERTRAACAALAGRIQIAAGNLLDAEQRLTAGQATAPGTVRPVTDLWLALLHNQRGDGATALRHLADEHVVGLAHQPFAVVHRHLQAGHALALAGRPVEALAEFDRFQQTALEQEASRFAGRRHNFRAWILRNLGATAEADDCNEQGLAEARAGGLGEPETHALLDLADARLRAGDLDDSLGLLTSARRRWDAAPALHWRQEMRYHLIAGRVALAAEDPDAALGYALTVVDESTRLGTLRYGVLGELLAGRARHAAGEPVPPHLLAEHVAALDRVAPLEAWAITATLASEFDVDAWARLAGQRAANLAVAAGPWGDSVRRAADNLLEGLPG